MGFGHEKLDVYRAAIEYVGRAYRFCEGLKGHRNAKGQLLRASQAIPSPIPTPTPRGTKIRRIANHCLEATLDSAPEPIVGRVARGVLLGFTLVRHQLLALVCRHSCHQPRLPPFALPSVSLRGVLSNR